MSIRFKLLILFLAISIIPLLTMRYNGERALRSLAAELGAASRNELTQRAGAELARLVEDHARVLERDRRLMETALVLQAREMESALANGKGSLDQAMELPPPSGGAGQGMHMGRGQTMGMMASGDACLVVDVSYDQVAYRMFGQAGKNAGPVAGEVLGGTAPAFLRILRQTALPSHGGEGSLSPVLWQQTALASGLHVIFPAATTLLSGQNPATSDWFTQALKQQGPVWTGPALDPLSREIALNVSMPIHAPDGTVTGVTAITVPAAMMVHENKHIKAISPSTDSYVVIPADNSADSLKVLAMEEPDTPQQGRRMLRLSAISRTLKPEDNPEAFAAMVRDIQSGQSGTVRMLYEQQPSLWVYGPAGEGTSLLLIVPQADVIRSALDAENFVISRMGRLIFKTQVILVIIMAGVLLASYLMAKRFTHRLEILRDAAKRLAKGDFSVRVPIQSKDELTELARTFNKAVPALAERVKMKESLNLAAEVQKSLLPSVAPEIPGLDVYGVSRFCDETGGDFFDYLPGCCQGAALGVVVGDASGHGVSAALLMAAARASLNTLLSQKMGMERALEGTNDLLCRDVGKTGNFMTMFFMNIAPAGISWLRAGHGPALLFDPHKGAVERLLSGGPAMGLLPGHTYTRYFRQGVSDGLTICLTSDGLWEARNDKGDQFGLERVEAALALSGGASAKDTVQAILDEMDDYVGNRHPEDDITIVVIKISDAEALRHWSLFSDLSASLPEENISV